MNAVPKNYYDGMNEKLLDAIPAGSKKILELGCANGRLGRRFKELHPDAEWHGVDISGEAIQIASQYLDHVLQLDLDQGNLEALKRNEGYDTVVIGDLLEHLRNPTRVLETLYELTTSRAQIVCCVPNMTHLSVVQRLISGDMSYDPNGLLDETHVRFYSPSSLFKLMLDSGWLPHLHDQHRFNLEPSQFLDHIVGAAQALGIPVATAMRNLDCYQMIVVSRKWRHKNSRVSGRKAKFSVVVPVNRLWQAELNIARSPGLIEAGVQIIPVVAESAAEAYAKGAVHAIHEWRVMAHQDVYFPKGTGYALELQLAALEDAGLTGAPVGFAGLEPAPNAPGTTRHSGLVIDRRHLFQHQPTQSGVSIDELAVCLNAKSRLEIDPQLGWHLWATDLCLQAERLAGQPIAQIIDIPLFHNSVGDYRVPPEFNESARRLLNKYPERSCIPTLCGELTRSIAMAA